MLDRQLEDKFWNRDKDPGLMIRTGRHGESLGYYQSKNSVKDDLTIDHRLWG